MFLDVLGLFFEEGNERKHTVQKTLAEKVRILFRQSLGGFYTPTNSNEWRIATLCCCCWSLLFIGLISKFYRPKHELHQCTMEFVAAVLRKARNAYNDATSVLPASILFLYFVNACELGFPMTAYGSWLNLDIKMSVANQSRYFAFTFLPWSFKPIYCWITERYTLFGENRRPYLIFCSLSSALLYLVTATQVHETWSAFLVTFIRQIFGAFSELLVGLMLVDFAHDNVAQTGKLQSHANAARLAGSGFSFLMALPLYGCGVPQDHGISRSTPPKLIIGFTAVFPVLAAIGATMIDPKIGHRGEKQLHRRLSHATLNSDDDDEGGGMVDTSAMSTDQSSEPKSTSNTFPIFLGILSVQWFMIWMSAESFVDFTTWVSLLAVTLILAFCFGVYVITKLKRSSTEKSLTEIQRITLAGVPLMFLFLLNATPTTQASWSTFTFYLFPDDLCRLQLLSLFGTISGLFACWIYSSYLERFKPELLLVVSVIVSGLLSLLRVPMVNSWNEDDPLLLGMSRGSYLYFESTIAGIVGKIFFLAVQVYATQRCCEFPQGGTSGSVTSGMMYGVYLSFINFGDSAAGWVTAPLISALGIEYGSAEVPASWDGLNTLIAIASSSKAIVAIVSVGAIHYMKLNSHLEAGEYDRLGRHDDVAEGQDQTNMLSEENTLPDPLLQATLA